MTDRGDWVGKTLGQYQVLERIGHGGMGIVYRARDLVLERDVAMKVLPPAYARNDQYVQRFMREAKSVARLDHPNIVAVYGAGEQDGDYYIVMYFVDGDLLQEIIDRAGRLDAYNAVRVTKQVADALSEAHSQDIVHRDIKPANIMIGKNGVVKVMDFGLARLVQSTSGLTATGATLGTPKYMSPEQCEGQEVSCRTDVFSMGVVLFEMLTGRLPYDADSDLGIMYQIVHKPFPDIRKVRDDVPQSVVDLLDRMVVKDADQRTITASEVSTVCDQILRQLTPAASLEEVAAAAHNAPDPPENEQKRFSDMETISATPTAVGPKSLVTPATPGKAVLKHAGPWGEARPATPMPPVKTPPLVTSADDPIAKPDPTPAPKSKGDPWGGTGSVSRVSTPASTWQDPAVRVAQFVKAAVRTIVFLIVLALLIGLVWIGFGQAGLYPLPDSIRQYIESKPASEPAAPSPSD